ncbi:hypothetical protein [Nocardia sp. NPDC057030]|uniref:hypothetical protein n=1 Tax=unclassified Nocardia TaxID=2637762 RepID=UPI0036421987
MTAYRAALADRDPRVRKSVREVPVGGFSAVQLRWMLQAAHEVLGDDSLYYAWPDCVLTQQAFAPESVQPAEFKARLTDPDPSVRRSVWLTLYDQAFANGEPQDFFHVVLEVLGAQKYAYAWPDCRTVLDGCTSWSEVLASVARVLAYSADGLGARLAAAIGLPSELYPPQWPAPPQSGSVRCWFCAPDQQTREEHVTTCAQVRVLVTLLSCSVEQLRNEATAQLVRLGPGVAGVLRQVRRTRVPGRRAALAALAEIGWDEVDPADRAMIRRLLRVQQLSEAPEPVRQPRGTWYAVPTTDRAAVLDAFGLREPVEVSLRIGFAMWDWANRRRLTALRASLDWPTTSAQPPYTSHYPEVFVTPALDGWTLVLTDDEMLDESHEAAYHRCAELSRRFGAAHWYNEPSDDYAYLSGWCVAENGAIVHHATYGNLQDGVVIGPDDCDAEQLRAWLIDRSPGRPPPTDETPAVPNSMRQRMLHISMFGTDPGEGDPDDADAESDNSHRIMDERTEFSVARVAWRLSVGLQTLGAHTRVQGTAVLAVHTDPPPKRYGTPSQPDSNGFRH